jgi:hypothetical protein
LDSANVSKFTGKLPDAFLFILGVGRIHGAGQNGMLDLGSLHVPEKGVDWFKPVR